VTSVPDAYDLVVVGAGPAGATAALAALDVRPEASVLVLDRAAFPRDKPCGDGVAPEAFDVWDDLGAPGIGSGFTPVHWLHLGGTDGSWTTGAMRRPAQVIPRMVLDERLVRAAVDRGAVLHRHRVRRIERTRDGLVLDGSIRARRLVGADGPSSVVRRALGLPDPPRGHVAVALRGYADVPDHVPHAQVIRMDGMAWPGYSWSFPIGDGTANVGYGVLLDGRRRPSRAALEEGLRRGLPWVGEVRALRGHLLPLASHRPRQPDGPVLLAGDALSLVNPISGEGIVAAAASGRLAGRLAMSDVDPGRLYRQAVRRTWGRHHRSVRTVARLAHWPGWVDAGLAAAARDKAVFDDLVALALADGTVTAPVLRGTLAAAPMVIGRGRRPRP
jgi:menaquinone-9 beta-reductase